MSTKPHVLRKTRTEFGLSQAKLARLVGCSVPTIKKIESGQLRPSAGLAHRIFMQTRLNPEQLMNNELPESPSDPGGHALSKDMLKALQLRDQEYLTQKHVDENLRHYGAVLETLLDASTRQSKLWALRPALQDALDKLIKDFDLEKDFRRLLFERFGVKGPWFAGGYNIAEDLNTVVNGGLFEERRSAAKLKRQEFYELKQGKPGKNGKNHESGRKSSQRCLTSRTRNA